MKSKIIVGNQKMLMGYKDVKKFVDNFKYKKDVIIIPSDIYVSYYLENGYNVGIQNISKYELGSYTGSVSALQAKSMKIKYALVGHSELNENPHIINLKIKQCIKNDIKVILCVSETIKNKNSANELKNQILDLLEDVKNFKKIIIAYEPVYSIGTGYISDINYINNIIKNIKQIIKENYNAKVPVLYGGSINESTIKELKDLDVDGFLVGIASTDYTKFSKIIEVVNR